MAGNTLTFYTSCDFTGGGTIDFTVYIRQPYANTTSNCQVKIKAEGASLKKTYTITSQFSSRQDTTRYTGPSLTIPGGTNTVESNWTSVSGLSCNTGSTYFYGQMTMRASSATARTVQIRLLHTTLQFHQVLSMLLGRPVQQALITLFLAIEEELYVIQIVQ